jgi:hypothetical protein
LQLITPVRYIWLLEVAVYDRYKARFAFAMAAILIVLSVWLILVGFPYFQAHPQVVANVIFLII